MKSNMGNIDRLFRLIIGVTLISLVFWGPKTLWGFIGIIPLITVFFRFCPLYVPFKISTKKNKI